MMKTYCFLTTIILVFFSSFSFAQQIEQQTLEKKAPIATSNNSGQANVHGPATPITPSQKNKTNNVIVESVKLIEKRDDRSRINAK